MSIGRHYDCVCDAKGCNARLGPVTSLTRLRQIATDAGWWVRFNQDPAYCAEHYQQHP